MHHRKLALLAILFATGLAFVAAPPLSARPRPAPAGAPREATIQFVWYRDGQPPVGGVSDMHLTVAPNDSGHTQVGVVEELIDGAGSMMVAATWLAAFNASLYTGKPLVSHQFLAQSTGLVDGPSAGMLMTAGFVALLDGLPVRPEATMTGTINPDFSAGPVGGIVQKMQGARARGKTLFGYPVGSRMHRDLATGETVDLDEVAQGLGLRAVEVKNVDDAVEVLTGKRRKAVQGLPPEALDFTAKDQKAIMKDLDALRSEAAARTARTSKALNAVGAGRLSEVVQLVQSANGVLDQAAREVSAGDYVAAEVTYTRGIVLLETAYGMAFLLDAVARNDFHKLETLVAQKQQVVKKIEAAVGTLARAAEHLGGPGATVHALDGYRRLATAIAFARLGQSLLERFVPVLRRYQAGEPADAQRVMAALALPYVYLSAAEAQLVQAQRRLERPFTEKQGAKIDTATLASLARSYASAGRACLRYYDTLVVEPAAAAQNVSMAGAQEVVASQDSTYALARFTASLAVATVRAPPEHLLALAAGADAYLTAGLLVNKSYSLGGSVDESGTLHLSNRRALTHQLELGQRLALEAAAEAKAELGHVPLPAKEAFLYARARREGNDEDKLEALSHFWWSSLVSRLAVQLARS